MRLRIRLSIDVNPAPKPVHQGSRETATFSQAERGEWPHEPIGFQRNHTSSKEKS